MTISCCQSNVSEIVLAVDILHKWHIQYLALYRRPKPIVTNYEIQLLNRRYLFGHSAATRDKREQQYRQHQTAASDDPSSENYPAHFLTRKIICKVWNAIRNDKVVTSQRPDYLFYYLIRFNVPVRQQRSSDRLNRRNVNVSKTVFARRAFC